MYAQHSYNCIRIHRRLLRADRGDLNRIVLGHQHKKNQYHQNKRRQVNLKPSDNCVILNF